MEWYSWAVAVILLISSVISPIVTAIINNKHQLNLKKLDMYEQQKIKVLSNFIDSTEKYICNGNIIPIEISSNFHSSVNQLYIYFNIDNYLTFLNLEDLIRKGNKSKSNYELSNVVQSLSKQIKKQ